MIQRETGGNLAEILEGSLQFVVVSNNGRPKDLTTSSRMSVAALRTSMAVSLVITLMN